MMSGLLSGLLADLPQPRGPQPGGSILFPRRRHSFGRLRSNAKPIPPPPAKAARIAAGRAKLIAKAERSRLRSEAARKEGVA